MKRRAAFTLVSKLDNVKQGFTLIELVVVIAILSILFLLSLLFLNPDTQFKKARDAQRKSDINEVTKAVNFYYDDHQCFPDSIPWGKEWKENGTIYMEKVPNGPTCRDATCTEYTYIAENICPQWFSIFSSKESQVSAGNDCSLTSLSSCTPQGFSQGICAVGGDVKCSFVSGSVLLTPTPVGQAGPTSTPTSAPTDTPTPTLSCSKDYACRPGCNNVPSGTGDYCESNCRNECSQ